MISHCGIDCTRCQTFHATAGNDDALRREIQQYYKEIGMDIAMQDLHCRGCHSEEQMPTCAGCPYKQCGQAKGLTRCAECAEYPCESLQWYTENYIKPSMGRLIL